MLYHICKHNLLPVEYRGILWLRASGAAPVMNLKSNLDYYAKLNAYTGHTNPEA